MTSSLDQEKGNSICRPIRVHSHPVADLSERALHRLDFLTLGICLVTCLPGSIIDLFRGVRDAAHNVMTIFEDYE